MRVVGAEVLVDQRRAGLERLLGVDDDGQRLVLDEELLRRVNDAVLVGAEHDGDGLADVLDACRCASGMVSGVLTSTPGGTQAIGHGDSSSMSSPVKTRVDAGRLLRAPSVSIETILACASGDRTIAACSMPGSTTSST